ncbi:glycoside hydrolase family 3 C-terminal domain-containing protein [Sphingobium sp. CCH11-B1]|jgi:beta-glucosidase|uniref:glycoside hydrolase family 3 C-terminal domain-containing protein n=1 Tax=Sphingobium sp. CCH11-B1 TaxID=1768781 RepID=UPI00082F4EC0|nr:glycoside hydrolase family 3 C-terminal domain-containing protein [Sphingobium sp. CCH11-B1]MEA3391229.1 glycoside hydrolase family 3 C-terminal domain-containing protein [Pseudomonadota bacterium]
MKTAFLLRAAGAMLCVSTAALAHAQATAAPAGDVWTEAEAKARAIVGQLTLDEKVDQLLNTAPAIPRLNIPAYNWWTESLHGAIGAVPTTNFPEPIGLAATFDAPLVSNVAEAISTEVQALHTLGRQTGHLGRIGTGLDTWSPNINIFRDPRWGRGQETYGEDPFLTAHIGVAFVQGMQGDNPDLPNVVATPKHYAVHSGPEPSRHTDNIFASKRDLEDTYLPAFRAAIVEGKAGSIMCAYNRVDGEPACGSPMLLTDYLRDAWGFKGYVVSDCDAVVDIYDHHKYAPDAATGVSVALRRGVDSECNNATLGGKQGLGDRYKDALAKNHISMEDIDTALVRLFSARLRNGDLPGLSSRRPNAMPVKAIGTAAHQALALETAEKSLVLLKNDGILPLKPGTRIALAGPLADATRVLRGNYSSAKSAPPVSVSDGLRQAMPGAAVTLIPFSPSITDGDLVPGTALRTPDGKPGIRAEYYNATTKDQYEAKPVLVRTEDSLVSRAAEFRQVANEHKVVWTGFLIAPETGLYRLALTGVKGEVSLNGKPVVSATDYSRWAEPLKLVNVPMTKGQRYAVRLQGQSGIPAAPAIFWKRITDDLDRDLAAGAKDADVIVAVVGLTSDLEGEEMPVKVDGFSGGDKTSLDLPADQRAFLEKAKATGKPLVIVAMNGSAIDLSWAKDNASAILESWYPGQSGGLAVGNVLSGKTDPGGRLPLTFYKSVADLPPFTDYGMNGRTYRYFKGTPVYRFGDGLSYTRFTYTAPVVDPVGGGTENGITVRTRITNSGARAGDDVAQLYITPPGFEGAPRIALRGFQRVSLKPGESRDLIFTLSPRDLSFVTMAGERALIPGDYGLSIGSGQPGEGVQTQQARYSITKTVPLPK